MTDHYRISEPNDRPSAASSDPHLTHPTVRTERVDAWLWIAIVLALAANVFLSLIGHDLLGIPCGLVVIGAGIALVVRRKGRKP